MRLARWKPGAAVDGVRIATAWTPELVRGLIRWQQEDRLTGVLTIYPMYGASSARQNRFYRETESGDAW